jgi:hypothetical protein
MSTKEGKVSFMLTKWLAIGGMAGSLLFIPTAFLIGMTRGSYSHIAQGISALSETGAPDAWAQTGNFIVVGFLLIGLAVGLQHGIGAGNGSVLGPALIATFGLLALVLNGVFPADPVGAPETSVGTAHSLTAGLGFIAVIVSMFILPGRFREQAEWQNLAALSHWFGLVSIVLMVTFLMAQEGAVQVWQPWTGLLQRGMGAAVLLWLFLLALRLYRTSR